jgi:phosphatidylglycerol:prolipoprotein diacylglycerol transferase
MYLVALGVILTLLYLRFCKKENDISWNNIFDFVIYTFLGGLVGGRLGYIIFYSGGYWKDSLKEIFYFFDKNGNFVGIYGMSYHGGVIGFIIVAILFCKRRKINFWQITDFILPALPAGYFFGRVGNFLNGELYGRTTNQKWGMDFGDGILRYPSQFLEAFFEGIFLFIIFWSMRNILIKKTGMISGLYLIGYAIIRFILEFFREPDKQLGFVWNFLTMGQILSGVMLVAGFWIIMLRLSVKNKNRIVKK